MSQHGRVRSVKLCRLQRFIGSNFSGAGLSNGEVNKFLHEYIFFFFYITKSLTLKHGNDMTEQEMDINAPDALNSASEPGTLVEVKFQKKPYQEQKYLEAEPKALGITQIMLSLFILSGKCITWDVDLVFKVSHIVSSCLSSVAIIAGSTALAAQNLQLPRLKACLGMQVVSCIFSVICFIMTILSMETLPISSNCWFYRYNETDVKMCEKALSAYSHVFGLEMLVQATQIALSATLASFCCKVIQCCSPRGNVPMIVVNAPPASQ